MNVSITKEERILLEYLVKKYIVSTNGMNEGYAMAEVAAELLKKIDQAIIDFDYDIWHIKEPSFEDRKKADAVYEKLEVFIHDITTALM